MQGIIRSIASVVSANVNNDKTEAMQGTGVAPGSFKHSLARANADVQSGDSIIAENGNEYIVESRIGAGGMGAVYRARDVIANQIVALKVSTHPDRSLGEELFVREASTLARLNHPNVPRLLDSGKTIMGTPYITMQLMPGRTLADVLHSEDKLSLDHTVEICRQIASIMAYAHKQSVVHNDLKPSNILINQEADHLHVCLLDFGISHVQGGSWSREDDALLGTMHYMTPEQISGQRTDAVSDVYQLGLIFFQCLAGQLPFSGDRALDYRLYGEIIPENFVEELSSLPQSVELLLLKALQRDPGHRSQSMQVVLADLDAVTDSYRRVA